MKTHSTIYTISTLPLILLVLVSMMGCRSQLETGHNITHKRSNSGANLQSTQPNRGTNLQSVNSNHTTDYVWEAYDAFNNMYLDSVKYIYKNTNRDGAATDREHGAAAIWCQPMFVDMALNAVELAKKQGDSVLVEKYTRHLERLLQGNIAQYLDFDFDNNDLSRGWFIYDDIQWWTITMARAYLATGNEHYRNLAEKSFARVWYGSPRVGDTGSYADPQKGLGGGMFWQWQPISNPNPNRAGDGKMSCINFPTVVAAMLLYEAAPEDRAADSSPTRWENSYGEFCRPGYETKDRYLEMAKEIYDWSLKNLADSTNGRVADNRHGDHIGGGPLIYNQGTFIGASTLLYLATGDERYLDQACKGADYSIEVMSKEHGMLPWAHDHHNPYTQGSMEQGVYPVIWVEYMKLLIRDAGQRTRYLQFIENNADTGWSNRDLQSGITDGMSWRKTNTNNIIGSYSAASVPALLLVKEIVK